MKSKKIIIYDFDGTLTPYPVPRFEILEKCGIKGEGINEFYVQVKNKAPTKNIDLYQALYETYFETIKSNGFKLVDSNLSLGCNNVTYNKGVHEFLSSLQENGIKNYLLSSGLKVFLDKVEVADFFAKIYATTFNYNEHQEVNGIKYLMSDKNKVDVIKEIISENNYDKDDCSDIIYIGDGLTDIFAMEYVKKNNGVTIFVYYDENSKELKMIQEKDVVTFYAPADFSTTSSLNSYVKKLCYNIK